MLRPIVRALAAAVTVALPLTVAPAWTAAPAASGPQVQLQWREGEEHWQSHAGWTTTSRVHHFDMGVTDDAVTSVDVRISLTPARAARPSAWRYPASLQAIRPGAVRLAIPRGTVLCVQARARDGAGGVSEFRDATACVSRAFGPGALQERGPVDVVHSSRFWTGRAKVARNGGALRFLGVRAGAETVQYVSIPRSVRTALQWTMPGREVGVVFGGGPGFRVRHGVAIADDGKTARVRGPITYTGSGNPRSLPVEGVAVMPRWMLRMTR